MFANRRAQKRSSTHFREIFNEVDDTAEQFWGYQMYFVVSEHEKMLIVPPPFSILYYVPLFLLKITVGL